MIWKEITDLKCKIYKYSVVVSLTKERFLLLDSLDYLDIVLPTLEKKGASDVELNKHFGFNIYFSVENTQKIPLVKEAIIRLILKYSQKG